MSDMDEADRILRAQLGPPPLEILQDALARFPKMQAIVLIIEHEDGGISADAGGCTVVQALGMLSMASHILFADNTEKA